MCEPYLVDGLKNNTLKPGLVLFDNKLWVIKKCDISERAANTMISYATAAPMFKYLPDDVIACDICECTIYDGYKLSLNNSCYEVCYSCADDIISGSDVSDTLLTVLKTNTKSIEITNQNGIIDKKVTKTHTITHKYLHYFIIRGNDMLTIIQNYPQTNNSYQIKYYYSPIAPYIEIFDAQCWCCSDKGRNYLCNICARTYLDYSWIYIRNFVNLCYSQLNYDIYHLIYKLYQVLFRFKKSC